MFIIGLVGSSGSGKGEVGNIFRERGYLIYDTDQVYHDLISRRTPCTEALAAAFGSSILNEDGSVNRRTLSDIVFASDASAEKARIQLNTIAHGFVKQAFNNFIIEHKDAKIILDAPLLFEAGMNAICDATLAVTAPYDVKVERIMMRDHLTLHEAERRIKTQLSDEELLSHCTYHIQNDGTLNELKERTVRIIETMEKRFSNHE